MVENVQPQSPSTTAPLGDIAAYCVEIYRNGGVTPDYSQLDSLYARRPDFRLWRVICHPDEFDSCNSRQWRNARAVGHAREAFDRNGVVLHGAFAILADALAGDDSGRFFSNKERLELAKACFDQLSYHIDAVPGCKTECGLIKALMLDAAQHVIYDETGCAMTVPDVERYLARLRIFLREADPIWEPGFSLSSDELRKQHKKRIRTLNPAGPRRYFCRGCAPQPFLNLILPCKNVFYRARETVRHAVMKSGVIDESADRLLLLGRNYAISAWLEARSYRLSQCRTVHVDTHAPSFSVHDRVNIPWLWCDELQSLWRVAQANRDCGQYTDAARGCYLLLRLIPDWLLRASSVTDIFCDWREELGNNVARKIKPKKLLEQVEKIANIADHLAAAVRQAGLAVDERFAQSRDNNRARAEQRLADRNADVGIPGDEEEAQAAQPGTKADPFALRVKRDQQQMDDWKLVCQAIGEGVVNTYPLATLERLKHDRKRIQDKQVLISGFRLSRHYNQLDWAADILNAIGPRHDLLIDFVHDVKRASQHMPLGIYGDTHQAWQALIREQWQVIYESEEASFSDALSVHEMLVGRKLTIAGTAEGEQARILTRKRYDDASGEELRRLHDETAPAAERGLALVTPNALTKWLKEYKSSSTLGAPVCASVVCLDDDKCSIVLASGKSDSSWPRLVSEFAGLAAACNQIKRDSRLWVCSPADAISFSDQGLRGLVDLAKTISQEGLCMQRDARWFMLAVDPQLVDVPWQVLFDHVVPRQEGATVVSLVPNLSWAVSRGRPKVVPGTSAAGSRSEPGIDLELDNADCVLADVCKLVTDTATANCFDSAGITVAHGSRLTRDQRLVQIVVDERILGVNDWWIKGCRRLIFIHSCHSGQMSRFVGDFGGVPGVVLARQTRLVIAPIAEISVSAIETLHRSVVASNGAREIGYRYLEAMKSDPQVGLYNLYGFADEPCRNAT